MNLFATIASTVAVGGAAVALFFTAVAARARHVLVTAVIEVSDHGQRLCLDITNGGAASVTVRGVWLWVCQRRACRPVGDLYDWAGTVVSVAEPALPTRIEGRTWQTWMVDLAERPDVSTLSGADTRVFVAVQLLAGHTVTARVEISNPTKDRNQAA